MICPQTLWRVFPQTRHLCQLVESSLCIMMGSMWCLTAQLSQLKQAGLVEILGFDLIYLLFTS